MAKSVRLRAWQKLALEKFLASERQDFLAVATPGAGKTTFALTAARHHLAEFQHARIVVVVPTQHLKAQWANAAVGFDLHLEPEWAASQGRLPSDMHGIVTTYQQVATNGAVLASLCTDAFVVFDEVHHAGDDRAWGDGIRLAFTPAGRRLALSGTPFRSDTNPIPFVAYDDELAQPDFEYGYGQALQDRGVVRPVYFPRINGQMEWSAPDGSYNSASFDDELDSVRAGQRLRTALSLDGQWLPDVLRQAHRQLTEIRKTHTNAAGLVIAIDQDHARGIAKLIESRFATRVTVATSDDPMASVRIAHFTNSNDPWIVAVRMVSEGVDIPRLRVGVFATNTTTDLFFRQAIGRLVRHTRGIGAQKAYMFIPDDSRLRAKAFQIAEHRRHSLRKLQREEEGRDETAEALAELQQPLEAEEKRSFFQPISAVALGSTLETNEVDIELVDLEDPADTDDESLMIELAPAPPLQGALHDSGPATVTRAQHTLTRAQHKAELRAANAELARELVALTGMTHAAVNGELNRLTGIKRITEATTQELATRRTQGEKWIARLNGTSK